MRVEERRLAAIVNCSDDAIVSATADGIVTEWNPGAETIFGYGEAEMIGRAMSVLASADHGMDMLAIQERLRRGETIRHHETQRCRKDGAVIDVSLTVLPMVGTDGQIVGMSTIARDITSAHRAQAALAEREAFLSSVLATVPEAMIVIDSDGIIRMFSSAAERLFGFSADEVIGQNVRLLMPPAYANKHDGYIAGCRDTNQCKVIGIERTLIGQRKDGSTFPIQLVIGEARAGDRRFFTGFVLGLTERQRTQTQLRDLQLNLLQMSRLTALGEMASTLAHELNQPLTAVVNYLQGSRMLLATRSDSALPAVRDAVNQAADQALRAGQVIKSLRDFLARGETERTVVNLPDLIREAGGLALLGAREDGIAVSFDIDPEAERVICNKVQVQQVLLNLIRNAVEAMHDCPVRQLIIASRRVDADFVELSVQDTGPGIVPEIRARLFQPFVTSKLTGMGVGLSIARTIVEAHGGRIWVEPRSEVGVAFRLTLKTSEAVGQHDVQ
ncbi:MAG TPA: PAS domain S-box protein [Acidisoma sp.]|nr:PAS domain S-box protein [Acidisoma sp.]